ncbi:UNVERIFIED_CONTAM: hypothetical protein K2H54_018392 [Gekko kuhli]
MAFSPAHAEPSYLEGVFIGSAGVSFPLGRPEQHQTCLVAIDGGRLFCSSHYTDYPYKKPVMLAARQLTCESIEKELVLLARADCTAIKSSCCFLTTHRNNTAFHYRVIVRILRKQSQMLSTEIVTFSRSSGFFCMNNLHTQNTCVQYASSSKGVRV